MATYHAEFHYRHNTNISVASDTFTLVETNWKSIFHVSWQEWLH